MGAGPSKAELEKIRIESAAKVLLKGIDVKIFYAINSFFLIIWFLIDSANQSKSSGLRGRKLHSPKLNWTTKRRIWTTNTKWKS